MIKVRRSVSGSPPAGEWPVRPSLSSAGQTVMVTTETDEQRKKREQQRVLFDGSAELYDATRQSYPAAIIDTALTTAAAGPGAAVLEVGCGTGQLTQQLAGRGLDLTAIDIGSSMAEAARRNVTDPAVRFRVSSFEEFTGGGPFNLIVSATAWHWVDPSVGWAKAARLLRPGGWLALLTTGERYQEPFLTQLQDLWMKYSRRTAWAGRPAWASGLRESSLFGEPVEARHTRALRLPAATVIGVERTRATFLSYSEQDQAAFTADLSALLAPGTQVDLAQETLLAMAPAVG
jgi:2-polyprenyl-3-methyl-5-hydroxy-6-metoxy-1,4-benzoquinol methylase